MLGAIFGKCGEYMKLDRDKSTFYKIVYNTFQKDKQQEKVSKIPLF